MKEKGKSAKECQSHPHSVIVSGEFGLLSMGISHRRRAYTYMAEREDDVLVADLAGC